MKRKQAFLNSVRNGRVFVCISCHRQMFENQVVMLPENWEALDKSSYPGSVLNFVGPKPSIEVFLPCPQKDQPQKLTRDYLCKNCNSLLKNNKMPSNCSENNLQFVNINNRPELKLTELGQQLVALNLLFQKIVLLPKSRMGALKDKIVSVPLETSDVMKTIQQFPRTPSDAGLAVVQLKRRLGFPGVHIQQHIDLRNVFKALRTFMEMGNPHYQSILSESNFKKLCLERDPEGFKLLYPEAENQTFDFESLSDNAILATNESSNLESLPADAEESEMSTMNPTFSQSEDNDNLESMQVEGTDASDNNVDEEAEYLSKDPVARCQFNYNASTCFANNYPEMNVEENTVTVVPEVESYVAERLPSSSNTDQDVPEVLTPLQIAPGQGKIPQNMLQQKHFEVKSFPCLFPDGKNGKDEERQVRLRDQAYWEQRILNYDKRCGSTPSYVFMAAAHVEMKQMQGNINLSFQRGTEKTGPGGGSTYSLDDPYMVLDNIKNTPRYWKKARQELHSKLHNFGNFTFFFTLSCADMRWPTNFTSLLCNHKITYDEQEQYHVDGIPLDDFLKLYPGKHDLIKNNLLNATLNFDHRLRQFLKHIVTPKTVPLRMKYYSYRIEFQMRGAPHCHGILWLDWDNFNALPRNDVQNIVEAFDLIKNEAKLEDNHINSLVKLADMSVSVSLKDSTTSSIVKEVNVHCHTKKACKKYGTTCRFNFPQYPTYRTIISTPSRVAYPDEDQRKLEMKKHTSLLKGVKKVLEDEETMKKVIAYKEDEFQSIDYTHENPEGLSVLKERIEKLLSFVDPDSITSNTVPVLEQYEEALAVNKSGYSIHYRRDVSETMVNTYNPEWISAWNGNMDFQLCLDYFAVITYISEYYSKDDTGTMKVLEEALKESRNEDLRSRLKKTMSVFLTHRQIGESEAYYRVIQSLHMKHSNVATVFAPTGFNPSRFLQQVCEDDIEQCAKVVKVEGREGTYQEKPSLYDKYLRRNLAKQPHLANMCYAQFVKRYQAIGKVDEKFDFSPLSVKKDTDSNGKVVVNEDHIITHDYVELRTDEAFKLPKFIELTDLRPGELPYMKLKHTVALSLHKINKQKSPHEFEYSELQLYHPHSLLNNLTNEKESFEACHMTYRSSNLHYVKGQIMKYLESVEEGLERAEELNNLIGDDLDPQGEQDKDDDLAEGITDHPDYLHADPNNLEGVPEKTTGLFKSVSLERKEELYQLTNQLDPDQRLILSKFVNLAKKLKIARKYPIIPDQLLIVGQGGAGAGKSLLIKVISQWFERILREEGDDPDKPYILLTAFTGCAASNINGMTMHSAFNLNFGNEFLTLSDKIRDEKRELCKNLKAVIIDEAFVLKSDDFYKFHLRMQELKQNTSEPFGGVAVLLLGDILQLRPVRGRFIFELPMCPNYHAAFNLFPLWKMFQVVRLTHNHRQGEDRVYADILNRMRIKKKEDCLSANDLSILKERVRNFGDTDLPTNALYIMCTNDKVKEYNDIRLENMPGEEIQIKAKVEKGKKVIENPRLGKDGSIENTPLQNCLCLKIGAQVMLTSNVNVVDSLSNGALGTVVDFEKERDGTVKTVLVHFKNEKAGQETRHRYSYLRRKYPAIPVTPISMIECSFQLGKKSDTKNPSFTATQFPLRLAFACTAHKMQGSTVSKPDQLVIDLRQVFEAAQAYVMMSRVQSLSQLFILGDLPVTKIYASEAAVKELERLEEDSLNDKEKQFLVETDICSLNVRSLRKNLANILKDPQITGKIIALQETWLRNNENTEEFMIHGYQAHFVSQGQGKGVAIYYKDSFILNGQVNTESYQMVKVSSDRCDVVNIYFNQNGNIVDFLRDLAHFTKNNDKVQKPCFIVGDFNIDILKESKNKDQLKAVLSSQTTTFEQIVSVPTHEQGGLLDQVYTKNIPDGQTTTIHVNFPVYSDHAVLSISSSVFRK